MNYNFALDNVKMQEKEVSIRAKVRSFSQIPSDSSPLRKSYDELANNTLKISH